MDCIFLGDTRDEYIEGLIFKKLALLEQAPESISGVIVLSGSC